jgi:two-component system, chemotaxis family, chemotaxis protein CheY
MPDIVLADWVMPIFDGLELTQMIRQQGANANPHVPIIMLTDHMMMLEKNSDAIAGVIDGWLKTLPAKPASRAVQR